MKKEIIWLCSSEVEPRIEDPYVGSSKLPKATHPT